MENVKGKYKGNIANRLKYDIIKIMTFPHFNLLFLLGLALVGGTIGGRLFQRIRIPQVVGYIIIGIVIGESGLKFVDTDTIRILQPFNYFALGLIGFMIGGELKKEIFTKYGKQFLNILLFEGVGAFLVVSCLIGVLGGFLLGDWTVSWALGLLLGAIGSATAPAATTEVLREYRTRGPLTRTVLAIVAMDDALALLLFAIASSIAAKILGNGDAGILKTILHPLYKIIGAIGIGVFAGFILSHIIRIYAEEERRLPFSIGAVLLVTGLSLALKVDMILAAMTLGAIVVNYNPRRSKEIFKMVEGFTPPIFVLFFVLIGAKLNLGNVKLPVLLLASVYLIGRPLGKTIGANLGARISNAPESVRKYIPLCLLSQAGVAIGLSILATHYFPGMIGNTIVIIVAIAVLILELIGPTFIKIAVTKAGEVGLNITEEDFIHKSKASDVMDTDFPFIHKDMALPEILKIFSDSTHLYYPVIDEEKKLVGVITVDNIKNTFMEESLSQLLLAYDLIEPAIATTTPETPLDQVKELLNMHNLEYLCVVDKGNKVVGFIERRDLDRLISTKLIELQKQADSLDESR
ncbi:MAG: cation:proton antiporter [Candidatus Omnitrophica bacterium]|nr:cation:proton antiporter [Candidatus Omnitrophota bacterium]